MWLRGGARQLWACGHARAGAASCTRHPCTCLPAAAALGVAAGVLKAGLAAVVDSAAAAAGCTLGLAGAAAGACLWGSAASAGWIGAPHAQNWHCSSQRSATQPHLRAWSHRSPWRGEGRDARVPASAAALHYVCCCCCCCCIGSCVLRVVVNGNGAVKLLHAGSCTRAQAGRT